MDHADDQIVAVSRSGNVQGPTNVRDAGTRGRRSTSQRGYVLIVTSISMTLLLGLAGLAIDLGRMYVIRAELQSFADAAALSAALELNRTDSGLARARASALSLANGPHAMRWDMGTQPITGIATSFSQDQTNWQERPKDADIRFVRVTAIEPAPLIFLRVFQPMSSTQIAASSVAAKTDQTARLVQ